MDDKPIFERCRNPDGTYNGIKALSAMTGGKITEAEVAWMWERTKQTRQAGMTKEQSLAVLREEAKAKPWLKP